VSYTLLDRERDRAFEIHDGHHSALNDTECEFCIMATSEEHLQQLLDEYDGNHLEIYAKGREACAAVIDDEGDELAAFADHDLTGAQRDAIIAVYERDFVVDPKYPTAKALDWPVIA
jgi:hypothetical protein